MERGENRGRGGRSRRGPGGGKLVGVLRGKRDDMEFGSVTDCLGGGTGRRRGKMERVIGREGDMGKRFATWLVMGELLLKLGEGFTEVSDALSTGINIFFKGAVKGEEVLGMERMAMFEGLEGLWRLGELGEGCI